MTAAIPPDRLAALIADDPWIEHGLTYATTNVVDLERYRGWSTRSPHIGKLGRILRSTLPEVEVRKLVRQGRADARKIAEANARRRRQRARRKARRVAVNP